MGAIVFILFCLGVLIGVILLIYGLSKPQSPQKSTRPIVLRERGEIMRREQPRLPETLDTEFIEHELVEFRQSPNIISIYIDSLFKRFRTEQERKVLEKLIHYNDTVARGIASQAEIMRQKAELEEAITTYDIAKDTEIRVLKHTDAKVSIKESLAQREANIREANLRGQKPAPAKEESQKQKMTEKQVREKKVSRFHTVADDEIAMDEAQAQKLRELDERESKEVGEVENNINLSPAEKQRRLEEIDARYFNLRKKILTTPGGRT